jgi:asparagine synthetase B (glutamine-hydrolysing)
VDQSSGSVLCWNGEAWKFGSETIYDGNDGQILFNALLKATTADSTAAVLNVLGSISGPFAVVFWDKLHQKVFLGRDRLGRRSLLYRATQDLIEFSSISDWSHDADPDKGLWEEIDADGIYILSLSEHYSSEDNSQWSPSPFFVKKHPWEAALKSYVSLSSEHALVCRRLAFVGF